MIAPLHPWLADPNVVYVLLLLAFYGLFFELTTPGLIVPGFLGMVCLGFAIYAFRLLSLNETGLLILLTGIALMAVEIFVFTFGIAGLLGILAFIVGSAMLFDTQNSHLYVAWPLIAAMGLLSFTFIFMVLTLVIQSHQQKTESLRVKCMKDCKCAWRDRGSTAQSAARTRETISVSPATASRNTRRRSTDSKTTKC